jgi:hypothetical protein|tara:strand:+ start:1582 stop:1755 length:174 start_codon:yes stop_codon:yes gene_type:complete
MMLSYTADREVCVTLKHDVWQLSEPGTLCLTRTQAMMLRMHLNQLGVQIEGGPEEDG